MATSATVGCTCSGSDFPGRGYWVRIEYEDGQLWRLAEDVQFTHPRIGKDLTRAYRKVIGQIEAAQDERDLRNLKSRRLEKLVGDRAGQHSMRVNEQYRLIARFETREPGRVTVVVELVDYHP